MRLFLDTSVLLAAGGSASGASRAVFRSADTNGWRLLTTPYVLEETLRNLPLLPAAASEEWARLRPMLHLMDDVLTLDRPVIFERTKDRPILYSALAWADVLLTLDQEDFGTLLGGEFYGLPILKPGGFLVRERAANRLA